MSPFGPGRFNTSSSTITKCNQQPNSVPVPDFPVPRRINTYLSDNLRRINFPTNILDASKVKLHTASAAYNEMPNKLPGIYLCGGPSPLSHLNPAFWIADTPPAAVRPPLGCYGSSRVMSPVAPRLLDATMSALCLPAVIIHFSTETNHCFSERWTSLKTRCDEQIQTNPWMTSRFQPLLIAQLYHMYRHRL